MACSEGAKPWSPKGEDSQAQADQTVDFQASEDSASEMERPATAT